MDVEQKDVVIHMERSCLYLSYSYSSNIIAVVDCGDKRLNRLFLVSFGSRYMVYYRLEKIFHAFVLVHRVKG